MKVTLALILLSTADACSETCRVKVDTRQQCQAVCDASGPCEAWTFAKYEKMCFTKKRAGWTSKANSNFDSGFKNQAPYYEMNTNFAGGDLWCTL